MKVKSLYALKYQSAMVLKARPRQHAIFISFLVREAEISNLGYPLVGQNMILASNMRNKILSKYHKYIFKNQEIMIINLNFEISEMGMLAGTVKMLDQWYS